MMRTKTLHEIHTEGMEALLRTLGPVDMIRFLTMFDQGEGDYTKERKKWLKSDLHEISREIRDLKKKKII